jgi:hypothetical protein
MKVFGSLDLNTAQNDNGEWHVTIATPGVMILSLDEARDLARILREITHAPGALHRAPSPDPTFCEQDKA